MSEFSDFMTMKLIEQRRLEDRGMSSNLRDHFFEAMKLNRNINVRTSVDLIARIEVLASFFDVSKAELVSEMLESSVREAMSLIEKDGWLNVYLTALYKHMESNYGAVYEYDENGKPIKVEFPKTGKESE